MAKQFRISDDSNTNPEDKRIEVTETVITNSFSLRELKDRRDQKAQELQDIKDLIAATKTALGI